MTAVVKLGGEWVGWVGGMIVVGVWMGVGSGKGSSFVKFALPPVAEDAKGGGRSQFLHFLYVDDRKGWGGRPPSTLRTGIGHP